jgi:hypothetical protein
MTPEQIKQKMEATNPFAALNPSVGQWDVASIWEQGFIKAVDLLTREVIGPLAEAVEPKIVKNKLGEPYYHKCERCGVDATYNPVPHLPDCPVILACEWIKPKCETCGDTGWKKVAYYGDIHCPNCKGGTTE